MRRVHRAGQAAKSSRQVNWPVRLAAWFTLAQGWWLSSMVGRSVIIRKRGDGTVRLVTCSKTRGRRIPGKPTWQP